MGVASYSLAWFDSYLGHRVQRTSLVSSFSDPKKLTTGVLQGCILGPLLFWVYINGVQTCLKHTGMTLSADDIALYCSFAITSLNLQSMLDEDLHKVALVFREQTSI